MRARFLLPCFAMSRTNLVVSLVAAACLAACSSDDTTTGDDDGGSGDPDPGGMRGTIGDTGVSTLAGWNQPGYLDGNRQVNLFNNPVNVAVGPDGRVFVADFDNSKIRVVDSNGNASTVVSKQAFSRPFGLAFVNNTLYVGTDRDCNGMHDPEGSNVQLSGAIWSVDVGAKTATCLIDHIGRPRGLAALNDGRIAVADYAHQVIQVFDPGSGTISPIAGSYNTIGAVDGLGTAATFNAPYGVVQRKDGTLVVADWGNHMLREVTLDGSVSTLGGSVAGFADGGMSGAKFNHPQGVAMCSNGDIFITDIDNFRVRKISADGSSITTIAGNGSGGVKDSTSPLEAQFYGLEGLAVSSDCKTLYIADGNRGEDMPYNRIRIIKL